MNALEENEEHMLTTAVTRWVENNTLQYEQFQISTNIQQ
jgi:hypothetical protein